MNTSAKKPKRKMTAQAMVEFALALPVLLLVLYGLLETGRLLFMYASVVTAARQAARYGSASGDNGAGTNYYSDCAGIRAAANRVAFIQRFSSINVAWDTGPDDLNPKTYCAPNNLNWSSGHPANGDRIRVTVSSQFRPIVPLLPFQAFTITSTDNRTLLIAAHIEVTPAVGGFTGGTALALGKTADTTTYDHVGQVITYNYAIQNTGSDAIPGPITITDDKIGTIQCPNAPNPLPGGSGVVACNSATYTITAADIAAASVTNTARAVSSDNTTVSNIASVTITFIAVSHISLQKIGVAPAIIDQGQRIQYTFTITNDGNVPLTPPYVISDALIGNNWSCPSTPNPLPVNGTVVCTGFYTLRNPDIGGNTIDNTATATAQYGSRTVTSAPATASVLIPELYLVLSASPANITAVGQTVTYTYTFSNRTTASMSNITVTDTRGANGLACVAALAGGASGSCTHTYTVTRTDFDSPLGYFSDTASGTGVSVKKGTSVASNVAGVNVTLAQLPSLALVKSASPTLSSGAFSTGQQIAYKYDITNTGNVTLTPSVATPLKVTDSDIRVTMGAACNLTTGSLAPGATHSCTGLLELQDQDIEAGSVTSTGTASAKFGGTAVQATSTYTLITFYGPRLSLVKTADKTYFTGAGEQINYSYAIKNTGGVALSVASSFSLTDNKLGAVTCPLASAGKQLQLGASIACSSLPYPTTSGDVAAGKIDNTVSLASGGTTPPTSPAPAMLTIPLLTCDSSHPTTSPLVAITPGLNATWYILNNTGTDLHITGATITWSGGNLSQVLLTPAGGAGQSVWSGSSAPNGTLSLPTAGWPVIPYNLTTTSDMSFRFEGTAGSSIKVSLTFQESVGGTTCSITSP